MAIGRMAEKGSKGFGIAKGLGIATGIVIFGASLAPASAADYLRGAYSGHQTTPQTSGIDWAGVYAGGLIGMSVGQANPTALSGRLADNALPNSSITDLLADTINFRDVNQRRSNFGGFVGVNWQWEDVVVGVEADYVHTSLRANSNSGVNSLSRTDGTTEWVVSSTATSRAHLKDWATLRGRMGWAAGYFMPYLTAGVAFANLDSRSTVSGSWRRYDVSTPPTRTLVDTGTFGGVIGRRGITYGGVIGAGVDMALFSNFFIRAEWQHMQLASGGSRPELSVNTARVGAAAKF